MIGRHILQMHPCLYYEWCFFTIPVLCFILCGACKQSENVEATLWYPECWLLGFGSGSPGHEFYFCQLPAKGLRGRHLECLSLHFLFCTTGVLYFEGCGSLLWGLENSWIPCTWHSLWLTRTQQKLAVIVFSSCCFHCVGINSLRTLDLIEIFLQ